MNSSTESPCAHVVSTLIITITSVISLAAFIGNFLVTLTFLKTPSLKTSTNYYIVNMAISDILSSCFNWLLYATEGMLTSKVLITEPSASVLCKLGLYYRTVLQVVSVLSLVLIAVDRYIAVVFPLKTTIVDQRNVRLSLSMFTWIVPIAIGCPYLIYSKVVTVDDQIFCRLLWNSKSAHMIVIGAGFFVFYCTPLIVMIILYSRITKVLRRRTKTQNERHGAINNHRQRQQQKTTKILISIVVAFFVCWTPLCVYLALKMFQPNLFVTDHCRIVASLFFYVFPSLSTAINPLILFLFSTNYRLALSNLCPWKCFPSERRIRNLPRAKRVVPLHVTGVAELHQLPFGQNR